MGRDKALIEIGGKPLVEHVIDKAGLFTDSVLIITNQPGFKRFGFPCHQDIIENCGPLGGIYTGLFHSKTKKNLVLSCDIPLVPDFVLEQLLQNSADEDVLAVRHNQKIEPLCAVYDRRCKNSLKTFLKNIELKMQVALQKMNTSFLDLETSEGYHKEWFTNINTPGELKTFEKKLL